MKKLLLLSIVLFFSISLTAQTSCQTSSGGNAFAGFTTIAQTITLSGCTGSFLHSIQLEKSGSVSNTQISKVEIFSGSSLNSGDLLYSSDEVIDLPDNNGENYTITFHDGTCNGGGLGCLEFSDGDVITVQFTFLNQSTFSGWGVSTNNSNPYAGGTIWGNGAQVSSADLHFDLRTDASNPLGTSCQSSTGGNAFAGFTTIAQTITLSGCSDNYLHSIELEKSGTVSNTQINKVEIFSGSSLNSGDLLYSSDEVIDLPDNNGENYTIRFNNGTCNDGGANCLQFSDGDVITVQFTFLNQSTFSGWGVITNNSNPYAGGTIWGNGAQVSSADLHFDLRTDASNPLGTSCQSSTDGNAFAGFTTIAQTITLSGCSDNYLHSIELEKSGTVSNTQINKVEIFSGSSLSSGDLLYSSDQVIDLPDNNGENYTIIFNTGNCNGNGIDCLLFSDGDVITVQFTFVNQSTFSGWGVITNNSNPYAGGTIWGNGAQVSSADLHFDLRIARFRPEYLPVELVSFNAQIISKMTRLSWQTAAEKNNEGFDIERSADGKNWQTIGFVQGYGTTQEEQNYTFIDETPLDGNNYYRLKQIDFDGQFEYSMIEVVELATDAKPLSIYPNPIQNELNIINGEGQAMIYNTLGQLVKELTIDSQQWTINTSDLPKGQYILHIIKQNGNMITKQFIRL